MKSSLAKYSIELLAAYWKTAHMYVRFSQMFQKKFQVEIQVQIQVEIQVEKQSN